MLEKIKAWASRAREAEKDLTLVLIVLLTASVSFGLGRLSKLEEAREPVRIEMPALAPLEGVSAVRAQPASAAAVSAGAVVASKNGAKYYLPSCSGAKRIKTENLVSFPSREAAEKAGYEPAKNCKGI